MDGTKEYIREMKDYIEYLKDMILDLYDVVDDVSDETEYLCATIIAERKDKKNG